MASLNNDPTRKALPRLNSTHYPFSHPQHYTSHALPNMTTVSKPAPAYSQGKPIPYILDKSQDYTPH